MAEYLLESKIFFQKTLSFQVVDIGVDMIDTLMFQVTFSRISTIFRRAKSLEYVREILLGM